MKNGSLQSQFWLTFLIYPSLFRRDVYKRQAMSTAIKEEKNVTPTSEINFLISDKRSHL